MSALFTRNPSVMTGKDIFRGIISGFPPAELTAPRYTGSRVCPGTGVPVLSIPGCFLVGGIVPVMPAIRQDMVAELTFHENRSGERTPRPAKVNPADTFFSRKPASVEDITKLTVFNGGCCSNI